MTTTPGVRTGDGLPLERRELLAAAHGRRLVEVERLLIPLDSYRRLDHPEGAYLAAASGPTQLTFADGLVHALSTWPSQLSLLVGGTPFSDDPYAEQHRLSEEPNHAPAWLRDSLGRTVTAVRVHVFIDDEPSDEARQAGISYELDGEVEIFYCIELHGRMSGDELLRREDLPRVLPARTVQLPAPTVGDLP